MVSLPDMILVLLCVTKQMQVDHWVWELVPAQLGELPLDERSSVSVEELTKIWLDIPKSRDSKEANEAQEWGIKLHRTSKAQKQEVGPGDTIDAKSWSVKGGHSDGSRPYGRHRRVDLSDEELHMDQEYATKLAAKWRYLTRHSRRKPSRPVESSHPVDWKDPEMEQAKKKRRKEIEASLFSRNIVEDAPVGGLVPVAEGTKPRQLPSDEKERRAKPWLNPNEPEYRQSRFGINDIPLALKDPRRRKYGFNYGLPKQKELLRAANARDPTWDQKEWPCRFPT